MATAETKPAVLVVGAGPVGLLLATLLARYEVPFRVIDRDPERHAGVRAAGVQPRSLELLERIGLAERFVETGLKSTVVHTYTRDGRRLKTDFAAPDNTRYPFVLILQQYHTERLIEDELESHGGHVERGLELAEYEQEEAGVRVTLSHADGTEEATFDYLVGCDGAHSAVREGLGWGLEGGDYVETFIITEADVDWPYPPDDVTYIVREEGVLVGAGLPQGRMVIFGNVGDDQADLGPTPTDEEVRDMIAAGAPDGVVVNEVFWASRYHLHHRCAPAFHRGRVFLAGDAAHICSSFGAHGMNLGFQDVFNLAWKLAHAINHGAPDALLESYSHERRGAAQEDLALTDAIYHGHFDDDHSLPHWVDKRRHALMARSEAMKERERRRMAQLDVGYRMSPIVAEHDSGHPGVRKVRRHPGLSGHRSFHRGPAAGERLPDGRLRTVDGVPTSLADSLAEGIHTLLLLTGAHGEAEDVERLEGIAAAARDRYGDRLAPRVICSDPAIAPAPPLGLTDPGGEVHHLLGADSDCLYLVRPDLYIGFRAHPAELEPLSAYLDGVLQHGAAPATLAGAS